QGRDNVVGRFHGARDTRSGLAGRGLEGQHLALAAARREEPWRPRKRPDQYVDYAAFVHQGRRQGPDLLRVGRSGPWRSALQCPVDDDEQVTERFMRTASRLPGLGRYRVGLEGAMDSKRNPSTRFSRGRELLDLTPGRPGMSARIGGTTSSSQSRSSWTSQATRSCRNSSATDRM